MDDLKPLSYSRLGMDDWPKSPEFQKFIELGFGITSYKDGKGSTYDVPKILKVKIEKLYNYFQTKNKDNVAKSIDDAHKLRRKMGVQATGQELASYMYNHLALTEFTKEPKEKPKQVAPQPADETNPLDEI